MLTYIKMFIESVVGIRSCGVCGRRQDVLELTDGDDIWGVSTTWREIGMKSTWLSLVTHTCSFGVVGVNRATAKRLDST